MVVESDTLGSRAETAEDVILMKINGSGDKQWIRKGGSLSADRGNSVFADIYGNVYTTGYFTGTTNFDATGVDLYDSEDFVTEGGSDMFIAKYNSQGTLQWVGVNGSDGADIGYGLYVNEELALLSGYFSNTIVFGNDTLVSTGGEETGFFVFDNDGAPIFGKSLAGDMEDRGAGLVYDENLTQTTITGYFKSTTIAVPPLTALTNASAGTKDGFIAAFDNPVSVSIVEQIDVACNGESTGKLTAETFFGALPITYNWSHDGGLNDSVTNNLPAGEYTLIVVDNTGARDTVVTTITEQTAMQIDRTITDVSCFGLSDGEIDITPAGGTPAVAGYTYFWTGGTGIVTDDEDQTGLYAGDYDVTVTDSLGCTADSTFTIGQPTAVAIDSFQSGDVTIAGLGDGWAKVYASGGTPAYTYDWSSGGTTDSIFGLDGGNYSVDVTDANGCLATDNVTIYEPGVLIATVSAIQDTITCYGDADGSARATASGGTRPYSWDFSSGTIVEDTIATNLGPGYIKVTVTDFFGAKAYDSIRIVEPGELTVSGANLQDVSCFGYSDGGMDLSISGGTAPFSYLWSNGSTESNLTNISEGLFSVTVTDAHGCQDGTVGLINEPDSIEMSFSLTDACYGEASGEIDLTVSGGTPGYTYFWSNTLTSEDIDFLFAGKYWVDVTDSEGCYNSDTTYVLESDEVIATAAEYKASCYARADGQTIALVTGGTSPYTYLWDDLSAQTDSIATDLGPDWYYTVTATDINGCSDTGRVYLNEQDAIMVNTDSIDNILCPGENGNIYISHNGTAPFTYDWTPGNIATQNLMDATAGIYELDLIDAAGCQNLPYEDTIKDLSMAINIVTQQGNDPICSDGDDGKIVLKATGGSGTLMYSIDDKLNWQTDPDTNWTDLAAGSYITVIQDASGCEVYGDTLILSGPDAIVLTLLYADSADCYGASTGGAAIQASGGTGTLSYSWDSGETKDTIMDKAAGKYTVIVTDENMCVKVDSVDIEQPDEFLLISTDSTWEDPTGTITITVSGGTLPYTYSLTGIKDSISSNTMVTFEGLAGGDYHFTIVDGNNCGPLADSVMALSIGNPLTVSGILLYPNPTTGKFTIEMENSEGDDINIEVINLTGQLVFTQYYNFDSTPRFIRTIDLGNLAKGTYFIRINGKAVRAKLLIE